VSKSILEGPMARLVADALKPVAVSLVYQQVEQEPVDTDKPWQGTTESVQTFPCKGWVDSFSRNLEKTVVQAGDLRVFVLAETLAVTPETTGRIVVDGRTLSIIDVRRDPAGATWELQARK
jgi:hypothetical protein